MNSSKISNGTDEYHIEHEIDSNEVSKERANTSTDSQNKMVCQLVLFEIK
jgi:hypothetical protein